MKKTRWLPFAGILFVLAVLIIGSAVKKDITFSSNENRYLQQKPTFSLRHILDGQFEEEAEEYLADQILFRDFWMSTKSEVQRFLGKKDVNDVYLGKDGYYFEKVTEDTFPQEQFEKNLQYVLEFSQKVQGDFSLLLAPTPDTILQDKLPDHAQAYDAETRYELVKELFHDQAIDVRTALSSIEDPYYHTDHHWTTFGAYEAYKTWCEANGTNPETYELKKASDSFYGTMYSKVLLSDSVADEVYAPQNIAFSSMECDGENYDTFYFEDRLEQKDHYEYFMGGNYAIADITTGCNTGRRLLIIKDSFANSFVPFTLAQYDQVIMLDLRYYKQSISDFLTENTDVLVLYEMTNFASDQNLAKLKVK